MSTSKSSSPSETPSIDGGHGTIPVLGSPDIVLSAAGDIASLTPANTVMAVGQHTTVTASQDINLIAQRHQSWAVKDGVSFFTRGDAKDDQRAVQDTGMKFHAASGNVNVQAQDGSFTLTAQQAIDIQSTHADVVISAPNCLVLNGGGGYIKLEGGNIEIGTKGSASFLASLKVLEGGASVSFEAPPMAKAAALETAHHLQYQALSLDGQPLANRPYVLHMADGTVQSGKTDAAGKTRLISTNRREQVQVYIEDADHHGYRLIDTQS